MFPLTPLGPRLSPVDASETLYVLTYEWDDHGHAEQAVHKVHRTPGLGLTCIQNIGQEIGRIILSGNNPHWPLKAQTGCAARMSAKSGENLRTIRFAEELLPEWAQLLDVAARLCPVSEDARRWFSRFTAASGVDDARTVNEFCSQLRTSLQAHKNSVTSDLQQNRQDSQPSSIFAAWTYALDTMILEAQTRKTCYWIIEGTNDSTISDSDSGDITLRRV